jgi:hypothetical protein
MAELVRARALATTVSIRASALVRRLRASIDAALCLAVATSAVSPPRHRRSARGDLPDILLDRSQN